MLELFKIFGTIAINNKDANDSIDDTVSIGQMAASKLGTAVSIAGKALMAVATTTAASIGAMAAGIGAITKQAVDSYGEYEQLVGGAELMYGEAYDFIADKAANAFRTVQMSQNDYLQQANGFATGLKVALDGDSLAAAQLADKILKAEADIVAATGNSQESVQNAFNGIMKSNYTMLDNLQIGIKPTKEGMQEVIDKVNEWNAANGQATSYMIDNLADCQSALVAYIEMQGLSNYAAREASQTISGSMASVQAAWNNLLTGMADSDQNVGTLITNLSDSIGAFAGNIVPRIAQALPEVITGLSEIATQLAEQSPELIMRIGNAVVVATIQFMNEFGTTIPALIDTLLPVLITQAQKLVTAVINNIPAFLEALFPEIGGKIGETFKTMFDSLTAVSEEIVPQVMGMFEQLVPILVQIGEEALPSVVQMIEILLPFLVQYVVEILPLLLELLIPTLDLLPPLVEILPSIIALLIPILDLLVSLIPQITNIFNLVVQLIAALIPKVTDFLNLMRTSTEITMNRIQNIIDTILGIISNIIDIYVNLMNGNIIGALEAVWGVISGVLSLLLETFKYSCEWCMALVEGFGAGLITIVIGTFNSVKSYVTSIINIFKEEIEFVKNVFTGDWQGAWENIVNIFKGCINMIPSALEITLNNAIAIVNGMIAGINKITGFVGVSLIPEISPVNLPRLAEGGVLEKGQIGFLEGNGAEAVVPLENNRKWIANVAKDMQDAGIGGSKESIDLLHGILNELQSLNSDMYDNMKDSIADGLKFKWNDREFGRMVKAVN